MNEWKPETPRIYREGLIEVPEAPGFVVVPYCDTLAVNRSGDLLDLIRMCPKKTYVARTGGGYHRFWHDSCNYARHHVVCSTFLVKPRRDVPLVVNHRDGIGGHDWLDNLEWVTYSENSLHAVYTGLVLTRCAVDVKDLVSGQELHFPSVKRCADGLAVPEATLGYHLKNKLRGRLFRGQYQIKLSTEQWVEPIEAVNPRSRDDNVAIASISYSTGQVFIFESISRTAREFSLSEAAIGLALRAGYRKGRLAYHDDYVFFYRADVSNEELSELSADIKAGYLKRKFLRNKHKGIKVIDLVDGTVWRFRNQNELGKHWGIPAYEVSRSLQKTASIWKNRYEVEYLYHVT